MDTSEKIASLRSTFGLSQEELAARIGVARQTVVSWEQGARPSAFNRRRIIEEFSLPINYFDADVALELIPADRQSVGMSASELPRNVPSDASSEAAAGVSSDVSSEAAAEGMPLSNHAQRASDAFRSLGTVIRWGNVFFAGVIALGALFSIATVLILVSGIAIAQAEGAVTIIALNGKAALAIMAVFLGSVIAFYSVCFFVRLLLKEILRDHVRRKRDDEVPFQQNKQN